MDVHWSGSLLLTYQVKLFFFIFGETAKTPTTYLTCGGNTQSIGVLDTESQNRTTTYRNKPVWNQPRYFQEMVWMAEAVYRPVESNHGMNPHDHETNVCTVYRRFVHDPTKESQEINGCVSTNTPKCCRRNRTDQGNLIATARGFIHNYIITYCSNFVK